MLTTSRKSNSSICKGKFPHSTHVSNCSAHQWTSEVFNIFHRGHAKFEFGKPCHSHCLLSKSYFQHCNIFSHFRVKMDADMLLFQVYFLSTQKSQVEQHTITLTKTTLSNNTCYSLTRSRQGLRRLLY